MEQIKKEEIVGVSNINTEQIHIIFKTKEIMLFILDEMLIDGIQFASTTALKNYLNVPTIAWSAIESTVKAEPIEPPNE
jgi:hypothetical protein